MPIQVKDLITAAAAVLLAITAACFAAGQTPKKDAAPPAASPKVTQIDLAGLKALMKPNGKPLLINFWATWCDPCREEFPDLVKIDTAFKGRIDFITISLDEPSEIGSVVPKFLGEMKATMPAYLLATEDPDVAINAIKADWNGDLPLTLLIRSNGETAYFKRGKVKPDVLSTEIDKLLAP